MPDITKVQQAVQKRAGVRGVRDLNARLNGERVEIHGVAESIEAKQNAMRTITQEVGDTGLVNLIQVSTGSPSRPVDQDLPKIPPGITSAAEPAASNRPRTHTVQRGETLSHIAQRYYGKASEYKQIFEANRDKLSDPDKIREGMTLRIP